VTNTFAAHVDTAGRILLHGAQNPPWAEVSKIPTRISKTYSIHMGRTKFQTKIYVNISSLWIWRHFSSKLCSLLSL